MATFLLALDQATQITGFAVYKNQKLIAHGHKTFSNNDYVTRIKDQRTWLKSVINSVDGDVEIAIEDIQLQEHQEQGNGVGLQTFKKLAQLQGALLSLFKEMNIDYHIVAPSEWRKTCGLPLGRGVKRAQQKAAAQAYVKDTFAIDATEDEADAICLGKHIVIQTNCYDWS